jgi:hypothetical protein
MRRWTIAWVLSALFAFASANSWAQQNYAGADYELELPSEQWRSLPPTESRGHAEFIYGDRNNGFLRIRKEKLEPNETPSDLFHAEELKVRFKPGFVIGKEEKFTGRLQGVTCSYEYTAGGKAMAGRIYFLQAGSGIIYVLHFTGLRDRLAMIRNQTDSIARSFRANNS